MIKGIDHYHHYLSLNQAEKEKFLFNTFPQWYWFDYASREMLFNPRSFVMWHAQANFMEQDLWFKVLEVPQQIEVLKIWNQQLSKKSLLLNYQRDRKPDTKQVEDSVEVTMRSKPV